MVAVFERLSIGTIILFFVIYLICHIMIGLMRNNAKKELEANKTVDTEKRFKLLNRIFKYFPMAYVIFLILVLGT
jgi:uncharacterized membrane protein